MGRVLSGVTAPVKKVLNRNDIDAECPENFRGVSECFAAIYFNQVSPETRTLVSSGSILPSYAEQRLELYDAW